MLASCFLCLALFIAADSPDESTLFCDGPLCISAKQLTTSMANPDTSDGSVQCWNCKADGNAIFRFGDVAASANGMTINQLDGSRYRLVLAGKAVLKIRGFSATANKISWAMDDRPMILEGDARIAVVVDGKQSTFAADTITLNADNMLKLSDGTIQSLKTFKVNALAMPR